MEATEVAIDALILALGSVDGETGWTKGVDMMPLLFNFTLDTATEFLFGESVRSQDAAILLNNPEATIEDRGRKEKMGTGAQAPSAQFGKDLEIIGETLLTRIRMQSLYWLGDSFRFRKAIKGVQQYAEYVLVLLRTWRIQHAVLS